MNAIRSEKGITLLEVTIGAALMWIVYAAGSTFFGRSSRQMASMQGAYQQEIDRQTVKTVIAAASQRGLRNSVWWNSQVLTAFGFPATAASLTPATCPTAPLNSGIVAHGEILGPNGIVPHGSPYTDFRAKYDVLGWMEKDPMSPYGSVNSFGNTNFTGSPNLVIAQDQNTIGPTTTMFTVPLLCPSGGTCTSAETSLVLSNYHAGDLIVIESPLGAEVVTYAPGSGQFQVTTLGCFQVGPVQRNLPAGFLPAGTLMYRVAFRMLGVQNPDTNTQTASFLTGQYNYQATPASLVTQPFQYGNLTGLNIAEAGVTTPGTISSFSNGTGFYLNLITAAPSAPGLTPIPLETVEIPL